MKIVVLLIALAATLCAQVTGTVTLSSTLTAIAGTDPATQLTCNAAPMPSPTTTIRMVCVVNGTIRHQGDSFLPTNGNAVTVQVNVPAGAASNAVTLMLQNNSGVIAFDAVANGSGHLKGTFPNILQAYRLDDQENIRILAAFSLRSDSPYRTAATDGKPIGADILEMIRVRDGIISGRPSRFAGKTDSEITAYYRTTYALNWLQ